MVIAYHYPTLQPVVAVLGILQQQWYESLDFQDLRGFLHENIVILEAHVDKLAPFERRVRAGHGDHLGFLHEQVLRPVETRSQQLESAELLELREYPLDVPVQQIASHQNQPQLHAFLRISSNALLPEAAVGNFEILLVQIPLEKRLRGVVEKFVKRKLFVDYRRQIAFLACVLPLLDSRLEALPSRGHLIREEVSCCFTCISDIAFHVQRFLKEKYNCIISNILM